MASKQRLNVLVVDRDEETHLELKDFLSEEGYQAFALSEPDLVVEEIKKGRFQLVLLDVSPFEPETRNLFRRNRIAYNGVGVVFHTDWTGNEFRDNDFRGNFSQVAVRGGGSAIRNVWQGNHWDDYEGFDRDGDGGGDTPYELHSWADRIWMEVPPAAFFRASPVLEVIDFLDRLAPFSSPTLILRDEAPRFDPPPPSAAAWRGAS